MNAKKILFFITLITFKANYNCHFFKRFTGPISTENKQFLMVQEVDLLEEAKRTNPLLNPTEIKKIEFLMQLEVLKVKREVRKMDKPRTLEDID